jgi:GGDEF domain-containing protein
VSDESLDPRLAERLARAVRAAQTLSETLWETLDEELSNPRGPRVLELSGQLGEVAATVASLARAGVRVGKEETSLPEAPDAVREPHPESRPGHVPVDLSSRGGSPPPLQTPAPPREPSTIQEPLSPAVLVDERAFTAAERGAQTTPQTERLRPAAEPPRRVETRPQERTPPGRTSQIEIRDERGEGGPAAWIESIGRRLERYEQDSSPFAVLLIELVGIERLHQSESPEELSRLTNLLENALARGLRPADALTCEGPGRYWLLAPQTDAAGAQLLAERISRGVRSSATHRGTPLEVAVGIALCPDDGLRASELAAHADVGLYAARADGRYR